MRRDLGSIFMELQSVKNKELIECNNELTSKNYNPLVRKALLMYKHELLESLEMYDCYLDKKETIQ